MALSSETNLSWIAQTKEIDMSVTTESTVGQWVLERPGIARVFEKLGIDYCCGGKKPLGEACRIKGLDAANVVALLNAGDGGPAADNIDLAAMSLTELADHIQSTHHEYLKRELPRLQPLIERIAARHSDKNPKIIQLPYIFSAFRSELEAHMAKEEHVLFPLVRVIDSVGGTGDCACGTITNPIRIMELEHQHAGDALSLMSEITDGFSTPPQACNTYRTVMHSLAELESDMYRHVHKENSVLFPRAIAKAAEEESPARVEKQAMAPACCGGALVT
jgi:regulator of cell morphogenesis and NO signaling